MIMNQTLRKRAEVLLKTNPSDMPVLPTLDVQEIVHELQVYQAELEIQNEELRRTQQELAEARDQYQQLYHSVPVGCLTLDANRTISNANRAAVALLDGVSREIIGRPLEEFAAPEDTDACDLHLRHAAESGRQQHADVRFRKGDGTFFWADMETTPTCAPGSTATLSVTLSDITERKGDEQQTQHFLQDMQTSRAAVENARRAALNLMEDAVDARQKAEKAHESLKHRLALEQVVATASTRLVNTPAHEVDTAVLDILASIGQITQTDRCYLFCVSADLAHADNTYEWCTPGVQPQINELHNLPTRAFPWLLTQLRDGDPLMLSHISELPPEAEPERNLLLSGNIQSLILVPIIHAGKLAGFIGCDAVRAERGWSEDDVQLLRTVGELLIDTLARLRTEEEIRYRAAELESINRELSLFNRAAVGREIRMIELKKEVNALCIATGQPPRHDLGFATGNASSPLNAKGAEPEGYNNS